MRRAPSKHAAAAAWAFSARSLLRLRTNWQSRASFERGDTYRWTQNERLDDACETASGSLRLRFRNLLYSSKRIVPTTRADSGSSAGSATRPGRAGGRRCRPGCPAPGPRRSWPSSRAWMLLVVIFRPQQVHVHRLVPSGEAIDRSSTGPLRRSRGRHQVGSASVWSTWLSASTAPAGSTRFVAFSTPTTLASKRVQVVAQVFRLFRRRAQRVEQRRQHVAEQLAVARLGVGVHLDLLGLQVQPQQVQVDRRHDQPQHLAVAGDLDRIDRGAGRPGICCLQLGQQLGQPVVDERSGPASPAAAGRTGGPAA